MVIARSEVAHHELVSDLIRALYVHGKIIGEQRLRDFRNLMDKPKLGLSIQELLQRIATLHADRIEGFVEHEPGETQSTWSILLRAANMLACFIWKGVQYANDNHQGRVQPHRRLDSAAQFLPALIACDRRWHVITQQHVKQVRDTLSEFLALPDNPYANQFNARDIESWADERLS